MRLGMGVPFHKPDGSAPSVAEIMARARLIETLGFDGIWVGDTIGRAATARPDVLSWLAVAAAGTEHIELGTAVIQVPLRNPVELAQRLSTLHAITGGRFVAGLGAGSTRADFDAVGVDYSQRFRMFAEAMPVIRQLCDGAQVGAADLHPWPQTVGGPPMLIGSWESGLWVRRAARDYDGWQGSGLTTLKALTEGIKRFRDAGGRRALHAALRTGGGRGAIECPGRPRLRRRVPDATGAHRRRYHPRRPRAHSFARTPGARADQVTPD
jgi:alkanesulfonate monooxygenase SsuD/methylene tetrahydromethanopterin reductase-like flavin-dependent oxidoreductase (luciferase family)